MASLFTVEVAKVAMLKILQFHFAWQQDHLLTLCHWNESVILTSRVILISRVIVVLWLLYLNLFYNLNAILPIHILWGNSRQKRGEGREGRGED